ncbi:MAG: sulfatase [Planctomycetes bacterium]|nr:sulfatase [Planctomycetota bacterium]
MNPAGARARMHGVLTGAAVGLVETALVLSGRTDTFERWYEWVLMPFAGVVVHVLLGWTGGALCSRWLGARRAPWWLLFVAGAAWLWKCRWMTVQPAHGALAIGGTLAAAGLLAALLRPRAAQVAAISAGTLLVGSMALAAGSIRALRGMHGVSPVLAYALPVLVAVPIAMLVARRAAANRWLRLPLLLVALAGLKPAAELWRDVVTPPIDRAAVRGPDAWPAAQLAAAPDLVLVTWDTVRADSLPCFGGGGLDTPALDRLVREGALFTDCRAVAPSTAPAHASLLSGVMPPRHGLRSNGEAAPTGSATLPAPVRLPEILAAAGWRTGGFVSTFVLRHEYGFDRGFERFDERGDRSPFESYVGRFHFGSMLARKFIPAKVRETGTHTPGRTTLARAQQWVAAQPADAGPLFLWTHFYDAHLPFTPESPFRERTAARAEEGPRAADPAQQDALVAQRAEIELLDALLAELLATLEQRDPGLRRTWVALVADHGECFGEGGHVGHHRVLYDATQHVALVVRPPTGTPGLATGVRIDLPCNQVDVAPTLLEAAGLADGGGPAAPDALDGSSLLAAWRGEELPDELAARGFYMEAFQAELGERRLQGWSERGWELVRALDGTVQLFAPGQATPVDVSREHPEMVQRLTARLDAWIAAHPALASEARELSAEEQAALDALGYGAGG